MKKNRKAYEERKAKQIELRRARREAGLCTYCGKPLDDSRYKMCSECLAVHRMRTRKYYGANIETIRCKEIQRYWERKKAGICVTCGKIPAKQSAARCPECARKQYEAQLRYRATVRNSEENRENV